MEIMIKHFYQTNLVSALHLSSPPLKKKVPTFYTHPPFSPPRPQSLSHGYHFMKPFSARPHWLPCCQSHGSFYSFYFLTFQQQRKLNHFYILTTLYSDGFHALSPNLLFLFILYYDFSLLLKVSVCISYGGSLD